jgi:hypothetical protein
VPRVEFGIFVGALGMIDAALGLVSSFMDIIPYLIQLGADVLAGLSYVAGGAVSSRIIQEWCSMENCETDCVAGHRSVPRAAVHLHRHRKRALHAAEGG